MSPKCEYTNICHCRWNNCTGFADWRVALRRRHSDGSTAQFVTVIPGGSTFGRIPENELAAAVAVHVDVGGTCVAGDGHHLASGPWQACILRIFVPGRRPAGKADHNQVVPSVAV